MTALPAVLALAQVLVAAPSPGRLALPFLHDDYPHALAEARARAVPIVVDVWAPW